MKKLTPAERLIVAADFRPEAPHGREWVREQVLGLADELRDTGVCLKVNSALRALGYGLIDEIHSRGLKCFADLKFFDIKETLSIDGAILKEVKPDLVTVVCSAGVGALKALKAELPDTEVLGVTILTGMDKNDVNAMFTCDTEEAVLRVAQFAFDANLDGFISSAAEVKALREKFGVLMSFNTPAIRPLWALVPGDDQDPARVMTPAKAIKAGVRRIVVGRPATKPPVGMKRREAVNRIVDEIAEAQA